LDIVLDKLNFLLNIFKLKDKYVKHYDCCEDEKNKLYRMEKDF
jgi:hypothetical protein